MVFFKLIRSNIHILCIKHKMLGILTQAVHNWTSAMKILNSQTHVCLKFQVSDMGYATGLAFSVR